MILGRDFYNRDTVAVARDLLGMVLVHDSPEGRTAGRIVETEAYITGDLASHANRGQTKRNTPMFGESGHAYIYFIYGVHWCFNVVTQKEGVGEAVLIRALEPMEGVELMQQRRKQTDIKNLCNGPAKLVAAMGITPDYNGVDITHGALSIEAGISVAGEEVVTTTRIGIIKSADLPLRFYIKDCPFISRS